MATFVIAFLSFLQSNVIYEKITYGILFNPIFIYTPLYLGLFVAMRIGAFDSFSPRYNICHMQLRI